MSLVDAVAKVLREHRWIETTGNVGHCLCGDCSGMRRDHEGHVAAVVVEALGLTEEVTADIAGPDWATYTRWVTPTTTHHGPKYLESR